MLSDRRRVRSIGGTGRKSDERTFRCVRPNRDVEAAYRLLEASHARIAVWQCSMAVVGRKLKGCFRIKNGLSGHT